MSDDRRFKWEQRFLALAEEVASWSKDPSTKCGAVIYDAHNRVISLGFNGFARGVDDSPERLANRETKLNCTIHAEENALLDARRDLWSIRAKIVVNAHPCSRCAAKICQSGIKEVAFKPNQQFEARWADDIILAREQFAEAGVYCHPVGRDNSVAVTMMEK